MYPGIPEYFDARGRGVYPFLTGSASWYLLTVLTQAFGVRGQIGDLVLCPKLVKEQFDSAGQANIRFWFAGRQLEVQYHNPQELDFLDYALGMVELDGKMIVSERIPEGLKINRSIIEQLDPAQLHIIRVDLTA